MLKITLIKKAYQLDYNINMINKYRAEIDGLRGIAVLGVILYHAEIIINGNHLFSGGFFGVDIFLVISGFLITRIISDEYKKNKKISFKNFYERRFRRLAPALIIVLTISTLFAYFILLPNQFIFFIKSALSSIFFISNFFFHYSGESYGQSILTHIPLLHTWSLSIEEQFYLIYPAFLIVVLKFGKKNIKFVLIIFIILSFIFSLLINKNHGSFNFYMLPSRGWELLLGAFFALNEKDRNYEFNNNLKSILSFLGLCLIIFSFIFFDSTNNHPGYKTLLPVIGTCIIIYCSHSKNFIDKALSFKILKNLGLISYSLYLWHHPIFSFAKIIGIDNSNLFIKFILFLSSILISFISFKYIETLFRQKSYPVKKIINNFLILSSSVFVIVYFTLPYQFKNFPPITRELYEKTWFKTKQYYKPCFQRKKIFCEFNTSIGNINAYLIGDSTAASLQEELRFNLSEINFNFIPMTNAGCDFVKKDLKNESIFCNKEIHILRKNKILEKKGLILIHLNYAINLSETEKRNFRSDINDLLEANYKIIFIYPIPKLDESISEEINKIFRSPEIDLQRYLNDEKNHVSISYSKFLLESKPTFNLLREFSHKNLYKVQPHKIFCNNYIENKCVGHDKNSIFYVDGAHLSKTGSILVNKEILKKISKIYE
tara:strand:+ start:695 stop:2671 length:1977 start_codon:yes stop_codon:yes gene_type:complete